MTGVASSNVHLDYTITTSAGQLSIDLAAAHYNASPTTAGCYKNTVNLTYGSDRSTPWSLSVMSGKVMARRHTLASVDVYGKSGCGAGDELLRSYQLSYQPDVDTGQPRLQSVQVIGRAGTPENSTPMPVASYQYGSASTGQRFNYQLTTMSDSPQSDLGTTGQSTETLPPFGTSYSTQSMLIDITGDGRPDLVAFQFAQLVVARNSSSTGAISFDESVLLSDAVLTRRALEAHTLSNARYQAPTNTDMTWRQAIDVNGDGRVDLIDAGEQPGHWVVYLNTPDPADPRNVRWTRRSISVSGLVQALRSRGMTVDDNYLPLARRQTAFDGETLVCWQRRGGVWHSFTYNAALCPQPVPVTSQFTITEWELRDVNGDGYPDVVFNSSPLRQITVADPRPVNSEGEDGDTYLQTSIQTLVIQNEQSNHVDAVFNVLGTHLTDGNDQPFSAPVTIASDGVCGVGI